MDLLKEGDQVCGTVYDNLKWKIKSVYKANGKARASLCAKIGETIKFDRYTGNVSVEDNLAYTSALLQDLKLAN